MGNIDILEKLEEYSKAGYVPMHMPGGKRNTEYASTSELDITEIDGFDNMHNADGIIKNASDRAAKLYGADKTLMLVNGSTAGILSAICGATKRKGKIIVARNCHVSVYNALIMAQLEPVYVIPEVDNDTGIYRGLSLEQIRKCVENNRDAQAVMITSPTYEGVVSEVREIASYLHEKGIPLIVDEAHGAHFEFSEEFPESAVKAGADIVINSIHKTLPALTQTALLHISGNYVDYDKVERFWNIYQTTSPSYILMASIDRCMRIIEGQGNYIFKEYIKLNPDTKLLIVGEGEDEEKLKSKADEYGISEKVIFTGARADINRLLQAMDIFVFPSLYEGLGISVLEAQASGLYSLCSLGVPKTAQISELFERMDLKQDASIWSKEIDTIHMKQTDRNNVVLDNKYDVKKCSSELSELYVSEIKTCI